MFYSHLGITTWRATAYRCILYTYLLIMPTPIRYNYTSPYQLWVTKYYFMKLLLDFSMGYYMSTYSEVIIKLPTKKISIHIKIYFIFTLFRDIISYQKLTEVKKFKYFYCPKKWWQIKQKIYKVKSIHSSPSSESKTILRI